MLMLLFELPICPLPVSQQVKTQLVRLVQEVQNLNFKHENMTVIRQRNQKNGWNLTGKYNFYFYHFDQILFCYFCNKSLLICHLLLYPSLAFSSDHYSAGGGHHGSENAARLQTAADCSRCGE